MVIERCTARVEIEVSKPHTFISSLPINNIQMCEEWFQSESCKNDIRHRDEFEYCRCLLKYAAACGGKINDVISSINSSGKACLWFIFVFEDIDYFKSFLDNYHYCCTKPSNR